MFSSRFTWNRHVKFFLTDIVSIPLSYMPIPPESGFCMNVLTSNTKCSVVFLGIVKRLWKCFEAIYISWQPRKTAGSEWFSVCSTFIAVGWEGCRVIGRHVNMYQFIARTFIKEKNFGPPPLFDLSSTRPLATGILLCMTAVLSQRSPCGSPKLSASWTRTLSPLIMSLKSLVNFFSTGEVFMEYSCKISSNI